MQGLPVGISFFAGAFAEGALISIAYASEQATLARRGADVLRQRRAGVDPRRRDQFGLGEMCEARALFVGGLRLLR